MPPLACFAVIPLVQIYLFSFRSRDKASLPFFSQIRCEWAVQMHNTGGKHAHILLTRDMGTHAKQRAPN